MPRLDRNRLEELRVGLDLRDRFGPAQTQRQLVRVYDGGAIPTTVPAVFLTHPSVADAADTEGASFSTSETTTVTIPVVVLGPRVPVAGDLLVAHAIAGRWLAGDGGGQPTPVNHCCTPCRIPHYEPGGTLTLSWSGSGGSGSATLTFSTVDGLQQFYATDLPWPSDPDPGFAKFGCNTNESGIPRAYLQVGNAPIVSGGSDFFCFYDGVTLLGGLSLADHTCSPFHLHFAVSSLCALNGIFGITDLYVDGPDQDPVTCCIVPFAALGCPDGDGNPQAVIADVSVWTDSSKTTLVASGTTEDIIDLLVPGTYYYEMSAHGFVTHAATKAFTCFTPIEQVTLDVASGFVCTTVCANPIATVLHGTHPRFGAVTYTYNGSGSLGAGWYATVNYSYPGCFCCPALAVTVTCFLNVFFNYSERWSSN